jgi:hypothetical protein
MSLYVQGFVRCLELENQIWKTFIHLLKSDFHTVINKENHDDWRKAKIVAELDAKRVLMEGKRKLVEIFEKKIQAKLASNWGGGGELLTIPATTTTMTTMTIMISRKLSAMLINKKGEFYVS